MGFDELSQALWRERELLETLLFKLEEEELLVAHGRTRWVGRAVKEVEFVLESIRKAELGRAVEAEDSATSVGLDAGASLREIASVAPEPWNELMHGHHAALSELTTQIAAVSTSNHQLLEQTLRSTQEALLGLDHQAQTYDPKGSAGSRPDTSFLIDEEI
ncbi:flagellar export chaperone FlgN [Demequina aestuarii]|uniref:flagellar export chaperone FlgN n=1 Tax=Demequina aestuarii TaxID=327095 RepID=UPI000782CCFE|nr:flagellar export chaperone FlgN [Demequina aestuarii]